MRDAEVLYLILAAIYLAECVKWLRHDAVVFRAGSLGWQVDYPGRLLGNVHGGFAMASPLPAAGRFIVAEAWPCVVAPQGVYFHVATGTNPTGRAAQSELCLDWAELTGVTSAGKEIRVAGRSAARAASTEAAQALARRLSDWARLPDAERGAAIQAGLAASADRRAARERYIQFTSEIRRLRRWTAPLAVLLLGGGAIVVWTDYWNRWPWLLGALLIAHLVSLWKFAAVHRRLYPTAKADRYRHLGMMLISPPAAARSPDALSSHVLADYHPLTVASVLLDQGALAEYAGSVLRDLRTPRLPVCASDAGDQAKIERWFREAQETTLRALASEAGLDVAQLLAPPVPESALSRAYCPRCRSQFVVADATCQPCGGLPLLPLTGEPVAAP